MQILIGIPLCTQYVLAELTALGADVPVILRLQITGQDIIGMQPLYGMIFGAGLLIAMIAAWGFVKWGRAYAAYRFRRGRLYRNRRHPSCHESRV